MKYLSLWRLLFISIFLIGLTWMAIVPIWHFPDEQAHFGQVAFYAEKGRNSRQEEPNLTEEIYKSEVYLGTDRDQSGNNKFTFHPEYRIGYTNSYRGIYEAEISVLTKTESKNKFVKQESSNYPFLYYLPSAVIYRLFYHSDLFVRVYTVRFWSLLLYVTNIWLIYKLSGLIYAKKQLAVLTLTILAGFQPMLVFANVGVNSDSLGNLLFTLFLYFSCLIIIKGASKSSYFGLLISTALSFYTKPQFIIQLPIIILLTFIVLLRDLKRNKKSIITSFILLLIVALIVISQINIGIVPVVKHLIDMFDIGSFLKYSREYTLTHTYSEVLPWYWGVYDWLGVTYPRTVHRTINYILLFSGIGIIRFTYNVLKRKQYFNNRYQAGLFLLITALLFFLGVSIYDWQLWYVSSFQLGVQGRYFFPLISIQMLILLIGWREMFSILPALLSTATKILAFLMVMLNWFALYTVAGTYYSLSTFSEFIIQASQYKPWFFKGGFLAGLIILALTLNIIFLLKYLRYKDFYARLRKK